MVTMLMWIETTVMPKRVSPRFKDQRPTYFFRAWREFRSLTQEQLAERVGMSISSVSQIETGAQGFTDSTLRAFAEGLGVDPGDLLSHDPRVEGAVVDLMRLIRTKDPVTILAIVRGLPNTKTGTDG